MRLLRGDQLSASTRAEVLRAFIYRWTTDNPRRAKVYRCALCDIREPYVNASSASGHTHPTIRLVSDEQWLREHAFYVTNAGRLAQNRRYAEPASRAEELDR